jgi:ATP-dependent exoDNAse (exonuclease V) beta subunit
MALGAWRRMCRRPDVQTLLACGQRQYEVPFSLRMPPHARSGAPDPDSPAAPLIVRGVIDCVVVGADRSVAVLEFKTGRPRPSHQQQLDTYVQAARILFPGSTVTGTLVYDSVAPDV